jgi:putative intracellular protease/amidase
MKVQIIVFDGFDEIDAIAPFEVLRNAAACGCGPTLVSWTGVPQKSRDL